MDKTELQKYIGEKDITVSEVMQKIDKSSAGILFLVGNRDHLDSCITDGDIRRWLLAGGSMTDPASKAANKYPKCAKTIEEAKALYHKRNYIAIPLIDGEGALIDIYTGNGSEIRKNTIP